MKDTVLDLRSSFINKGCILPEADDNWSLKKQGTSSGERRLREYTEGFSSIKKHEDFITKRVDIIVSDNTIDSKEKIDPDIFKAIPTNVKFNLADKNKYGRQNKGAGLIEYWRHSADIYSQYEWLLFYESRLTLLNLGFFKSFFNNKRTMFKSGDNCTSLGGFFTGMFTAKTKDILNFCNSTNLNNFTLRGEMIEQTLFFFYKENNITYEEAGVLDIIWYEEFARTRSDQGHHKGWKF